MQSFVLYPPNSQTLSGEVIGSVLERAWLRRRPIVANTICREMAESNSPALSRSQLGCSAMKRNYQHRKPEHERSGAEPGPRSALSLDDKNKIIAKKRDRPAATSTATVEDQPTKKIRSHAEAMVAHIKAYHRERRRLNQKRYRKKKERLAEDLQNTTRQLQEEVDRLSRQRDKMIHRVPVKETSWSAVVEYFGIFRNGLLSSESSPDLDLLCETRTPDMDAGTVRRPDTDALVRNWKNFTQFFEDVTIQLDHVNQVTQNLLVATTTMNITISEDSLEHVFPYLASIDSDHCDEPQRSHLAEKLLGQRLTIRGSVYFDWDDASKRVTSVMFQGDMLSPLLQLLGNLEDDSLVFDGALIQPDCNLAIGDHPSQYTFYC